MKLNKARIQNYRSIQPITNLNAVYLISTDEYCSLTSPLKLLDEIFVQQAKVIKR